MGGLGAKPPAENYFLKNDMAESENILTKLQDVLLYLIPPLNKFPRDQKFVRRPGLLCKTRTRVSDATQEICFLPIQNLAAAGLRNTKEHNENTSLED